MFDIKKQLSMLPELPGVYLMLDKDDKIIYVGKAKVLKNRVKSYFSNSKSHSDKVRAMVRKIAKFEYIITSSELEALVLECTLIKKHRPFYNILLKDDKTYPYLKITMNEAYPKILAVRKMEKDNARYFGPFSGMSVVGDIISIVKSIFKIPSCRLSFPKDINKNRPCINYQIDKCFAPCRGEVSQAEYYNVFKEICAFLDGGFEDIIEKMQAQMEKYSENLEFEKAAELRDRIKNAVKFKAKQKVVSQSMANQDVVSFECYANKAFFSVLFIRNGCVSGQKSMTAADFGEKSDGEISLEFLKNFYSDSADIPSEIIIKAAPEEEELILDWLYSLKGRKVRISVPMRGEKLALLTMAKVNTMQSIERFKLQQLKEKAENSKLEEIKTKLDLKIFPKRIESYDISNTGMSDMVGAMVVFENAVYAAKESRYFKIKNQTEQNDYLATCEIISRRIKRAREGFEAFLPLPDLILLDGGAGHVGAVKDMLAEMGENIEVWGMVKDDFHTFKALTNGKDIVEPSKNSVLYSFVYTISERVHKNAIEYHRKVRTKTGLKSELSNISGIGEKKTRILLTNFKSVENISKASIDELKNVGLDKKSAENVYKYFN